MNGVDGVAIAHWETWSGDSYLRIMDRHDGSYIDWDLPWYPGDPFGSFEDGLYNYGEIYTSIAGQWRRGTYVFCADLIGPSATAPGQVACRVN